MSALVQALIELVECSGYQTVSDGSGQYQHVQIVLDHSGADFIDVTLRRSAGSSDVELGAFRISVAAAS